MLNWRGLCKSLNNNENSKHIVELVFFSYFYTTFLDRSMFLLSFSINKNIFESTTDDLTFKIPSMSFMQFFPAGSRDTLSFYIWTILLCQSDFTQLALIFWILERRYFLNLHLKHRLAQFFFVNSNAEPRAFRAKHSPIFHRRKPVRYAHLMVIGQIERREEIPGWCAVISKDKLIDHYW